MRHTHPIPADETEAPLSFYIATAHEQIARTRATSSLLNGTRTRDDELARAMAIMHRDSDRLDRHYAANKDAIDAARAAADRSLNRFGRGAL